MKTICLILLALTPLATPLNAQILPQDARVEQIWDDAADARDLGNYDRALTLYAQAIALADDHAGLYNSRGKTYFDMAISGKYETGADSLLQLAMADYTVGLRCAVLNDKLKSELFVNRGAAYGAQGRLELAIQDLDQGLRADPKNENGYLNRALIYYHLKNYAKAIADDSRYLRLVPNDANIYYERGMLHRSLNHNKKAIKDLNRAISLQPDFGLAYLERARAHAQAGNKKAARKDYERARTLQIELAPQDLQMME